MRFIYKAGLITAALSTLLCLITYQLEIENFPEILLIASLTIAALSLQGIPATRSASFTLWLFTVLAIALNYPTAFIAPAGIPLKPFTIPLLQLIMFGMGTAMSTSDFMGILKMPKAVLIGLLCQFTIMPVIGYSLATSFNFSPEIATGIILVGVSPSGLASNVMAYIAKANLALSVTLTAIATLIAPFLTPLLMKLLAGQLVSIDPWGMMWSILKIVILPIAGGLFFNHFMSDRYKKLNLAMPVISMFGIAIIVGMIVAAGRENILEVGIILMLACLIHNLSGYLLGYLAARVVGLDERSCRTVSLEVGLQNGGLATGLAIEMGKLATVGLAPVMFSSLMNVTGSSLALWWRRKPV